MDSIEHRVIRMHTAAIVCAGRGLRLTYGELAGYMGRPGEHNLLGDDLNLWAKWLRSKSLPLLYAIVINKESGWPGKTCDVPDEKVSETQAKCYGYEWDKAPQPTIEELAKLRA